MQMHRTLLVLVVAASAANAAPECDPPAAATGTIDQAMERVTHLAEFQAWSAGHSFPVRFGLGPDRQRLVEGRCFWEVAVYANRPERQEAWETFYAASDTSVIYVLDAVTGAPITLKAWRDARADAAAP